MAKTVLTSWMGKIRTWRSDVWDFLNNIETLIREVLAVTASAATDSRTYNIRIAAIDKQYSQRMPDGTKAFDLKTVNGAAIRWAFESGRVVDASGVPVRPYNTLAQNESYSKGDLNFVGKTIYFACSTDTPMVELICYI